MATMPMSHSLPQEEVDRFAEDFEQVITATAALCPRMLYVPGNVRLCSVWGVYEDNGSTDYSIQYLCCETLLIHTSDIQFPHPLQ